MHAVESLTELQEHFETDLVKEETDITENFLRASNWNNKKRKFYAVEGFEKRDSTGSVIATLRQTSVAEQTQRLVLQK
jgi:hypothetical protein